MSGGLVPYHLRWNKAIDRSVFMEFLIKLNAYRQINDYSYVGFGAVHMEDFKLIHSLFSISDLFCLEKDLVIYNRQLFNKPLGCLQLENKTSGEFIAEFFPEKNTIVWLDYTNPRQICEQFREFEALLSKLSRYDVVKITVNANPNCLVEQKPQSDIEILMNERYEKLKSRLANFLPQKVTQDMMNLRKLPVALSLTLEFVSKKALRVNSGLVFFPVNSFVYSDSNHQMLTMTGVLINDGEEKEFIERVGLDKWEYAFKSWDRLQRIDIPDLTLKERMAIDSMLPCDDPNLVASQLAVKFDDDDDKSIEKIRNYIRYYRHYPTFSKIVV